MAAGTRRTHKTATPSWYRRNDKIEEVRAGQREREREEEEGDLARGRSESIIGRVARELRENTSRRRENMDYVGVIRETDRVVSIDS